MVSVPVSEVVTVAIWEVNDKWDSMTHRERFDAITEVIGLRRDDLKNPKWAGSDNELSDLFKSVVPGRKGQRGQPFWGTHHFVYLNRIGRQKDDKVRNLCFELADVHGVAPATVVELLRHADDAYKERGLDFGGTFLGMVKRLKDLDTSGKEGMHGAWSSDRMNLLRKEYKLSPLPEKGKRRSKTPKRSRTEEAQVPEEPKEALEPKETPETSEEVSLTNAMRENLARLIELRLAPIPLEDRPPIRRATLRLFQECVEYLRLTSARAAKRVEEGRQIDAKKERREYEEAYLQLMGESPPTGTLENVTRVKKVYREHSKSCHPDLNPNNPFAAEQFKAFTSSYATILNYHERHALNSQQTQSV